MLTTPFLGKPDESLTSLLLFLGRYKHLCRRWHQYSGPHLIHFRASHCFPSSLCILLTSMINLLFPSLKWWSDFQPPQCNASFGAQRAWVSCPCTSLSPGPGSISSVCGWAFPLNVPGSCSLVSFLLAHVL